MKGYFGRMLTINVTDHTWASEEIPEAAYRMYLGGKGLAAWILMKKNPPAVNPLSAENHIIFGLGPAADTKVWGSSRYGVFTRSPLTGFYAHSYSGGHVAEHMSRAGYDAFVIHGASKTPLALDISDEGVKFIDAGDLWGKDTYAAQEALQGTVSGKAGVIVIGPGGENQVPFAVIENNFWRSAGRGGVGAVLGSKKIKGIVFHGSAKREVAEPAVLDELYKEWIQEGKEHPAANSFRNFGTTPLVAVINKVGAFPTRYWTHGRMENYEKISADAFHERLDVKARACARCLMGCGRMSEVQHGRHKGLRVEGPEYETIFAFGGLCLIDEIEEIVYLNDICDRLGLDTISAGNLCGFAIEASQRGVIDEKLEYGDADAVAGLLRQMASGEGTGGVLARGIRAAAAEWGLEDLAIHVKGMEPAAYDPRYFPSMALSYATSDRGACHLRTTAFRAELTGQIGLDEIDGKAKIVSEYEDRATLQDSLIVCRFYRDLYFWDGLARIIHGTTGTKLDETGMARLASNIRNLSQRFNIREGWTPADDSLPRRFFEEPIEGGRVVDRAMFDQLIQDYYRIRGWDPTGNPPMEDPLILDAE
jgi:aldehyde:ferredoxin oxidoreductase